MICLAATYYCWWNYAMKLCLCMSDTSNWWICMWDAWHWCICIRDTCNDGTDKYACERDVRYHGFTAQVWVHFGDFVLVHIIQLGMCLLACVDHVFLKKFLLDWLHIQCVLHLLQHGTHCTSITRRFVDYCHCHHGRVQVSMLLRTHWLVTLADWTDWQ